VIAEATPKLRGFVAVSVVAVVLALVLRQPSLVLVAAPFLLSLAAAVCLRREPEVDVRFRLSRTRVLEGDEVGATIVAATHGGPVLASFRLELPEQLRLSEPPPPARLRVGNPVTLTFQIGCDAWGAFRPGRVGMALHDPLRLFVWKKTLDQRVSLRAYPRVRSLGPPAPARTQIFAGNHVARSRGEGFEFADLRPFAAGDRTRHINWRATARRREVWVNQFHPEQNADVFLFIDSFADERRADKALVEAAVRAAASLVDSYLSQRDRVGLISFGNGVQWLQPRAGNRQRYRLIEAMLETELVLSQTWQNLAILPPRVLPPEALVIAISPLAEARVVYALADIRKRGFDVAVIEVSAPVANVSTAADVSIAGIANCLVQLKREATRLQLRRNGVAVATWNVDEPLPAPIAQLQRFRRVQGLRG
jgi:uncharacterized protein (DUF58 family)